MSKEYLEAFKIVYNNFDYLISDACIENDDVNICLKTIKEQLPTIKRALQRLESIDNATLSEALECLERIIEKTDCMNNTCVHLPKCLKDNKCRYNIDDLMCPDYEMANHIKQYILKAQEQEANPSEALECLEWLTSSLIGKYNLFYEEVLINEEEYKESIECIKDDYNTIKQALLKAQEQEKLFDDMLVFKNGCLSSCFEYKGKQIVAMPLEEYAEFMEQEKALDIIKEKEVNIPFLKSATTFDKYNKAIELKSFFGIALTEEEFNLLKEVLE